MYLRRGEARRNMVSKQIENGAEMSDRTARVLFVVILTVAAAVRLYGLGGKVMFGDDALTHWFALMPAGKVIAAAAGERTPPLSHLLAHYWLAFAPRYSEFWLRLPFAVINLLAMFPLYGLGRAIGGRRAALAACLMFALSPLAIAMAQTARYPSIEIFLTLSSLYYLERYSRRGAVADLALFIAALAAGFYTHYFMLMFAASMFLGVVVSMRGRRRILAIAGVAAAFVVFAPWFSRFASRAAGEVGFRGLAAVAAYLKTMPFFAAPHVFEQYLAGGCGFESAAAALLVLLAVGVAALLVSFIFGMKGEPAKWLLIVVTILPPVAAWALKIAVDFPLVTFPQFSSNIAPLFFLCLAIGWSRLGGVYRLAAAVAILAPVIFALVFHFTTLGFENNTADAMRLLNEKKEKGDVVVLVPPECAPIVHFYGPRDVPSFGVTANLDPLQYNAVARAMRPPFDAAYIDTFTRRISSYKRAWVLWCGGVTAQPDPRHELLDFMDANYKSPLQKLFIFNAGQREPGALLKLYELRK